MKNALAARFFTVKTLTRVGFAVLSLGFGVAKAAPASNAPVHQSGGQYNWMNGGGG